MKKTLKLKPMVVLMAPIFGLALAAPSYAADHTSTKTMSEKGMSQHMAARDVRASELMGKDVRNAQGEDLGDIKDLVIDLNNGRIQYVVLSFGGFLGLGDKLFAYPIRAFKPAADHDELVLNVPKEKLKHAPGFDSKSSPDWDKADYRNQVDRYFGPTVAIKSQPNMRLMRASDLIGKDVNGSDNKDLGEIKDVVINMNDGSVRYAVLEFDQSWSLKDKLFAFPLRSFKPGAKSSDDLVLNVSKESLNNTPGFDKNSWPKLNDPKWTADIDRYLVPTTVTPLPSTPNDRPGVMHTK